MTRRPTIADVAHKAAVSVATVDRVLNKRHPVREDTARRVLDAAEMVGFHATGLLRQRLNPEAPERTFGFVLQRQSDFFYQALAAALDSAARAAPGMRGRAAISFISELTPAHVVAKLNEMGRRADAVAVVSIDHPAIGDAIEALGAKGIPTFGLLSGLTTPGRAGYIGIDNRKAGRTAAWTIAKTASAPGEVALLVGSHRYLGHEMREIGFRSYFREHAPSFRLLETLVNLEEPRIAYEATLELLERHPSLVGICSAGGGMEGVIDALRDEPPKRQISVVVNELTPATRSGLLDGVVTLVIATPVELLARKSVEAMLAALDRGAAENAAEIFLPFEIYTPENL